MEKPYTSVKKGVLAYSKPLNYFFIYILCIFIQGRLEIFRYRFSYT